MRLLDVLNRRAEWKRKVPNAKYAILSHKWLEGYDEEVVFADLPQHGDLSERPEKARSKRKLDRLCQKAAEDGLEYVWLDTCCIDQENPVELQESINSMYRWYKDAAVCYIYLAGFDSTLSNDPTHDAWFTRGWTLQEFVAPKHIKVFDKHWTCVGAFGNPPGQWPKESDVMRKMCQKTLIDQPAISRAESLESFSVAHRMSWYGARATAKPEDNAYCLMGIFSVNMPLLYGEGAERAFRRLQEEIMKNSDDHTLFAWRAPRDSTRRQFGLLAPSPKCFQHSSGYLPWPTRLNNRPYAMTNKGLDIDLYIMEIPNQERPDEPGLCIATLDCRTDADPATQDCLSVYLRPLGIHANRYVRVEATRPLPLVEVGASGALRSIFVKQPL